MDVARRCYQQMGLVGGEIDFGECGEPPERQTPVKPTS